jgi:hypothetical protein
VALVAESGEGCDFRYRMPAVLQQVPGTVEPALQEVLMWRNADAVAEQTAEVASADTGDVCQGDQGQVVAEMLFDEVLHSADPPVAYFPRR